MRLQGLIIFAVSAMIAVAQSGNSTISGSVKDSTDAPIPQVKVRIVNIESGTAVDTTTNDAGLYRVGTLLPGSYRLEVQAEGFDRLTRGPVTLEVGQVV